MRRVMGTAGILVLLMAVAPVRAQEASPAVVPGAAPETAVKSSQQPAPKADGNSVRFREIEERVADLKEKIYRSKSRLVLLREQILHNVIAEAKGIIVHRNEMGSAFSLEQVLYYLDGNKIYYQDNKSGSLDEHREFEIFSGNLMPGNHLISVEMVYRGSGGMFSYVDGYRFKLKSNYTFYATKGRITRVAIVGHERGGVTTSMEDKPYVSYEVQQFRYNKENLSRLADESGGASDVP